MVKLALENLVSVMELTVNMAATYHSGWRLNRAVCLRVVYLETRSEPPNSRSSGGTARSELDRQMLDPIDEV